MQTTLEALRKKINKIDDKLLKFFHKTEEFLINRKKIKKNNNVC